MCWYHLTYFTNGWTWTLSLDLITYYWRDLDPDLGPDQNQLTLFIHLISLRICQAWLPLVDMIANLEVYIFHVSYLSFIAEI